MNIEIYDVIIIGSGIAGLFTAANIDSSKSVLILTKESIVSGSSPLAQGGIVSQVNRDIHIKDTIIAGAGYNDRESLKVLSSYARECIDDLINYGVDFDRDENGNLLYTLEGGHSIKTILHCRDYTGLSIINVLKDRVLSCDNITIHENTMAVDIIDNNSIKEVVALKESPLRYYGRNIVIATGGIGRVYNSTTNPDEITGDGIAMALRAGVEVEDLEFVQFHPTALYSEDNARKSLISEAMRGEGAILKDIDNNCFMDSIHPLKSLAPRDIVSRAIFNQMMNQGNNYVYLDITSKSEEYLKNRFPSVFNICLEENVNISNNYIKVAPAQHYIMGGIKVNHSGMTSINKIYACGECAKTGVHGANRLASNSLLEAIVYGKIISNSINASIFINEDIQVCESAATGEFHISDNTDLNSIKERIGEIMDRNVSIVREEASLKLAKKEIEDILGVLYKTSSTEKGYYEAVNMATVAIGIIKASIKRRDSLGAFYRVN